MSYKSTITNSYGDEIYNSTTKLQELKRKSSIAKNQWIFMDRCLFHDVIPKSFRTRPTLNTRKGWNIARTYNRQMLTATRNATREKYNKLLNKISTLSEVLQTSLTDSDYKDLDVMTNKTKENTFIKEREKLKQKFENLSSARSSRVRNAKTIIDVNQRRQNFVKTNTNDERIQKFIKTTVLNLTKKPVKLQHTELLQLGPKFVPTPKSIPFMDIITSTESAAIDLDNSAMHHESEDLRHQVSNTLSKFINVRMPSNLTKLQRQALKELREDKEMVVYPFDKGAGFALLTKADALSKISEQLGEAKKIDSDPTKTLLTKFQRALSKLRKEGKFNDNDYREIYPSDAVPPRMYGMLKAHKPNKNFPIRTVVSTIGTSSHGVSKMLVKLIQPTLNKNPTRLINSGSFVNEAKSWNIDTSEVQVSYDVVALYPSVPISKAIDAVMDLLQEDAVDVSTRTKLELGDIKMLIELCLSKCYFLYENSMYVIEDAGPIGLSLMVVMAEAYLQRLEKTSLQMAADKQTAPITFKRYVDDSHARFSNLDQATRFLEILNAQDQQIQYTVEVEDQNKMLSFLDVNILNGSDGRYEFNVHRKDAITNVQIKPHSCINPGIVEGVFKGFLVRAHRLCSPKYIQEEINFLVNVFAENGHPRSILEDLAETFIIPENRVTQPAPPNTKTNADPSAVASIIKIPWIPRLGPKLRKIFKKHNIKTIFTSPPNLQSILCNHKSKLPENSQAGVYKLNCSCGATYVGETKKKVATRLAEHQRDIRTEKWMSTGCSEHARGCQGEFNWDENVTIAKEPIYRRRKIREALEIRRWKTGPDQPTGLNRDTGNFANTNSWNAIFRKL